MSRAGGGPGAMANYGNFSNDLANRGFGFGMQTGAQGVENYFNPYEQSVVQGLMGDFSSQRAEAARSAADMATKGGAFGGSRSAVLQAALMGDVSDREASTLANVRMGGYQNAMQQMMADRARMGEMGNLGYQGLFNMGQYDLAALGGLNSSFGYGNRTMTQTTPYTTDYFGKLLGLGATVGGAMMGGPPGAAAASAASSGFSGGSGVAPSFQPFGYNGYFN